MKKKFLFLFSAVLLFSTFSCKKDTANPISNDLTLHFDINWKNVPLVLNKKYTYDNGKQFFFSRFNYFITDVKLISDTGSTKVLDVAFLDFTNLDTDQEAADGIEVTLKNLPKGNFTGISLGLGVSKSFNKTKPANYTSDSPLSKTSEYWDAWNSYIFCKVEGKMDTAGNNIYDRAFAYHMGSDAVFRTRTQTIPVAIGNSTTTPLIKVHTDLSKLLNGIDLSFDDGTHQLGDIQLSTIIMDNFFNDAITIE